MKLAIIYRVSVYLLLLGIPACHRSSKVEDTDTESVQSIDDTQTTTGSSNDTDADTATLDTGTALQPCLFSTVSLFQFDRNSYPLGMDDENIYFHEMTSGRLRWINKQTGINGELDIVLSPKHYRLVSDVDNLYLYELPTSLNGAGSGTVQVVGKKPDFWVAAPIELNQEIGELLVENRMLFVTPPSRTGLHSYDISQGEETVWTEDTIESFHVSSQWVYWNSLGNDGTRVLFRQSRSGGEPETEIASGPISTLDFTGDRILLWTMGGAAGPPDNSYVIEDTVEGFLWMVPSDSNGPGLPHVVPGFDTYVEQFDWEDDPRAAAAIEGDNVYFSNSRGELWQLPLDKSLGDPTMIEIRGGFDDDDFLPWVNTDADAIYWFAGLTPGQRASDEDTVSIFRTCCQAASQ